MTDVNPDNLENRLKEYLGRTVPSHAASDIHAALVLADILKTRGYTFHLKDLCPGSPDQTRWQAVFFKHDYEFSADHPDAPVAVCTAAIGALSTLETTFSLS